MKKIGLLLAGFAALAVFLANVGPLLTLAVTLGIAYMIFKWFLKAESTFGKVILAIIGLCLLSTAIANIPSIIGLVAVFVLYLVYKKWNERKETIVVEKDPFAGFEREWERLEKR
ncbi:MAG: flagellar basal body rod protein [Bacillus sp. (in: firmicutes)]